MGLIQQIRNVFFEKSTSEISSQIETQRIFAREDRKLGSFSIIPKLYEAELDKKYEIKLDNLKNGKKSKFKGNLESNIFFNKARNYSEDEIEKKILKKYQHIPGFCSMRVSNKEELMKHLIIIHELSYNHYVFGKEENIKGEFPNWCCGYSARNLLLTLMEKGYPNVTYFNNNKYDHSYNGLPFLFGDNEEKGFIIIDPTSDQLFNDKNHAPRNNLFVVFSTKWKYETDWKRGLDLFPKKEDYSTFSNLHTLRKKPSPSIYKSEKIIKYFNEVFENPVDVKIDDI
jgi:hypothetical protein